ncbi:hypothetical protein DY023_06735 [Microbacterium bovistercoris]|uniref:Uncharacterized protein n=1 Tax=Microbacterium bovistercoris TaxID=2293570 RepID=A0A371NUZ1_9MICO|nr:hypothetical protein [Microbacterium bovistercoris]REJ06320.1 hypothetical protein DY023_06735 [Microbacterium bovistercoris]
MNGQPGSILNGEDASARPRWEVTAIDGTRWRIRDGVCRTNDAACLVAYIERDVLGLYDVLWLRNPCPARTRYRDIAHVLADLDGVAGDAPPPRTRRSEAPNRIAHLSPRE